MRKILIPVVAVAVLGGGYYSYWHKKAGDFKQMFLQKVTAINAQGKVYSKDVDIFHYDSVSISGFPFSTSLEIYKPVLNLPVSGFIQHSRLESGVTTPLPFEWVEEISYGDRMTVTSGATGKSYTYTIHGDTTEKSLVDHTPRHSMTMSASSPITCHLNIDPPKNSTPWALVPLSNNPKPFFADVFRLFECGVSGYALKDTASGNTLLTSGGYSLSASNEIGQGPNHKLAFAMDFEKMKATPAFDAIVHDYVLMIYTLQGAAELAGSVKPLSEYGDVNVKVDARYDGPIEAAQFNAPDMTMHFDINHLDSTSALYNSTSEVHLATVPQGSDRTISLVVHSHGDITERGTQLKKQSLAELLAALQKGAASSGNPEETQMFGMMATLGKPAELADKIYPDFHSLGKIGLDIDFNAKVPNNGGNFNGQGVFTLNDLSVTTTPYGIKVKGKAENNTLGKAPSGDLSITCVACDALLTDMGNYAMRIEALVDKATGKPPIVTKELVEATKQFLRGIAENATASDLVIHFIGREDGGFTVSGKQLQEVMALYMTTLAPYLTQPSPAAGEPPLPAASGAREKGPVSAPVPPLKK